MNLPADFQAFFEKLQLGSEQIRRMEGAQERITDHLCAHYGVAQDQIFLQGSTANGTAVKPDPDDSNGEYDVDLVSVTASASATPDQALEELEDVLAKDGDLAKRVERKDRKKPCVRLRYAPDDAGHFHVDVTPARTSLSAPLEIPRRGVGWKGTAPREYTAWCHAQGPSFVRFVQMLKRWRDYNQNARQAIKSIVLQVLIANHRLHDLDDARAIAGTLRAIDNYLATSPNSAPALPNPVLPSENLTERWSDGDYRNFRKVVGEAADLAEAALEEPDMNRSREVWRKLLGSDFPPPEKSGSFTPPPPPATGRRHPQKAPKRVEWG